MTETTTPPAPATRQRNCPVCGADPSNATLFLERSYDASKMSSFSYSSRKEPEYMSFRLVRCKPCDTVYTCETIDAGEIHRAYHQADYDSATEALLAAQTYAEALRPHLGADCPKERVLEIGAGTGVFLEQMAKAGFKELIGVEPSQKAIASASPIARPWLREGIFRECDFEPASLSLVCCFMTLEHVTDPKELVTACRRLLVPGGKVAFVTHDYLAWNNRVLGKRSPIIDIEHLQIFDRRSMEVLLTTSGFPNPVITSYRNVYPVAYWNRLFPFPRPVKRASNAVLEWTGLGGVKLAMNVGNLLTVATRAA